MPYWLMATSVLPSLPLIDVLSSCDSSALSTFISPRREVNIRVTAGLPKMPIKKETKEKQVKGDEGVPLDLVIECSFLY